MRFTPTAARRKVIEKIFKADIKWTITKGPGFNGDRTVHLITRHDLGRNNLRRKVGGWTPDECGTGVCAIAAHLLNNDREYTGYTDVIGRASRLLKTSRCWMRALYISVGSGPRETDKHPTAIEMGHRLRAYGLQLKKARKANKALGKQ